MYRMNLFVTSSENNPVIESLNKVFEGMNQAQYSIEVINVLLNPEKADQYNIIATPTLLQEKPKPEKRIVGDLMDTQKIKNLLDTCTCD